MVIITGVYCVLRICPGLKCEVDVRQEVAAYLLSRKGRLWLYVIAVTPSVAGIYYYRSRDIADGM